MYTLRFEGPCVTVFGSARLSSDTAAYRVARKLGIALGEAGFTVMTGAGPGLMEAANRGAREAGGRSVGCRVRFSFDEAVNEYLDRTVCVRYFFVRKVMMFRYSCAFVALPGGFGTLDELFEVLTLIQTKKVAAMPVVLVGADYWKPLLDLLESMASAGTIRAADLKLLRVTDDIDLVVKYLAMNSRKSLELAECARRLQRARERSSAAAVEIDS
jgi:uncharacterized protein (TIGR00730 family)